MAGKPHAIAPIPLSMALDSLSKNTLADMIAARAIASLGPGADVDMLATLIQEWLDPVQTARGDRRFDLAAHMAKYREVAAKHREKYGTDY